MAPEQHKVGEAAQDNVNAAIGGVILTSQNIQAIASEFAQMSLESVDNAAQVVDRFSKARSWDQIIDIQNKFLKSSIDTFTLHGAKVAELMTAWPSQMGKSYRQVSKTMFDAGNEAMKTAADQNRVVAERTAAVGEHAGEALRV